jgi:subtilisin family serine protease
MIRLAGILAVAVLPILPAATPALSADGAPGDYIVVLRDGAGEPGDVAVEMSRTHGLAPSRLYSRAVKGFAASVSAGRLDSLKRDSRVLFVSEDRVVSAAAKHAAAPPPPSQILPTGIDRINAENLSNNGTGIDVAVLDTGIDLTHPDLKNNIVGGKNCSTGKSYADGNGHGTHVSGTVAALDNSAGVVGAAPEARLWAVRVLDNSGNGTWSSIICGLDFVLSKAPANGGPIKVVNLSLSGTGASDNDCGRSNKDALHQAICRVRDAGVTVVAAAGNSGRPASGEVPAAYDDAVITVSALVDSDGKVGGQGVATGYGADDTFANFSNYGPEVDIAAPGVNIRSTWKGGGYSTVSGTSMAAPHVSAAAALYLAGHSGAAWTEVRDALKLLAEPAGSGHSDPSGLHPEGLLQAAGL